MEPLFSFIIPHKNTPELLQKCIDSIPHREDVQIIVVDDNSDASKVDFEHFPGLDDPKVEVHLTKEGRGAGYARNIGLDHAQGKWLVFADSDDFFNPCIAEAMNLYPESEYDIIFFKASCLDLNTGQSGYRHIALNKRIDEAYSSGNYNELLFFSIPWAKFFRRSFVVENAIRFQEVRWANDVLFSTKCGLAAKKVVCSNIPIYCVTSRKGSLIKDTSFEAAKVRFEVDCESSRLINQAGVNDINKYWTYKTWARLFTIKPLYALSRIVGIFHAIGPIYIKYVISDIFHSLFRVIKKKSK